MTAPTFLLAASAATALLALVLSFLAETWAGRVAMVSLWLALATVPCSIAWDIAFATEPGADVTGTATPLRSALSHVTGFGVAIMPGAGIAMVALRRARIASSKRAT